MEKLIGVFTDNKMAPSSRIFPRMEKNASSLLQESKVSFPEGFTDAVMSRLRGLGHDVTTIRTNVDELSTQFRGVSCSLLTSDMQFALVDPVDEACAATASVHSM